MNHYFEALAFMLPPWLPRETPSAGQRRTIVCKTQTDLSLTTITATLMARSKLPGPSPNGEEHEAVTARNKKFSCGYADQQYCIIHVNIQITHKLGSTSGMGGRGLNNISLFSQMCAQP